MNVAQSLPPLSVLSMSGDGAWETCQPAISPSLSPPSCAAAELDLKRFAGMKEVSDWQKRKESHFPGCVRALPQAFRWAENPGKVQCVDPHTHIL